VSLYVRYVEICHQAAVDPSPPQRVRELVGKWNQMLTGKPNKSPDPSSLRGI